MNKIEIPKGLKKVECILNHYEEDKRMYGKERAERFLEYYPERFTVGKIYPCKIDKTGKVLILKTDKGQRQRASYKYFKPVEIIPPIKKSIKKRIAAKLIKLLRKF